MTISERTRSLISSNASRLDLEVTFDNESMCVRRPGAELTAQTDLGSLALPENETSERAYLASFFDGVSWGLRGKGMPLVASSFAEAAGHLLPRIDGPGMAVGACAAGWAPLFTVPFFGELLTTYWMVFDTGPVPLTSELVERWGVTRDRVHNASRSLLFHLSLEKRDDLGNGVRRFAVGDGHDSGRALIVGEIEWDKPDTPLLVGIPSAKCLLYQPLAEDLDPAHLRATVRSTYEASEVPVSPELFKLDHGTVVSHS